MSTDTDVALARPGPLSPRRAATARAALVAVGALVVAVVLTFLALPIVALVILAVLPRRHAHHPPKYLTKCTLRFIPDGGCNRSQR